MGIDLSDGYKDLMHHRGHHIVCVTYSDDENVAIECEDCNEVLIDFSRPEKANPDADECECHPNGMTWAGCPVHENSDRNKKEVDNGE